MATNACPCDTTVESRMHVVGSCAMYKEKRGALEEETRKLDACDMEEFGRLKEYRENDN